MIINKFEEYDFKNSGVEGIKITINFSLENHLNIVLHEETQDKYEQVKDIETVKTFPPLLFSVNLDPDSIKSLETPKDIRSLSI